jgi:hypothetical protein
MPPLVRCEVELTERRRIKTRQAGFRGGRSMGRVGVRKRRAGTVVETLVPIIPWTALFLIDSHERQFRVHRAVSAGRKKIRGTLSPDLMELPT